MESRKPGSEYIEATPLAPPELKAGEVHLWKAHTKSEISLQEEILSTEERLRIQRYRFPEDRRRFVLTRLVLRRILGGYQKRPPELLEFKFTAYGKPYLSVPEGEPQIEFNVSHSGAMILLAFARDIPVGVDVERIQPLPDMDEIAGRFFAPGEQQDLFSLREPEKTVAFYHCWTRKEAVIKARGEGLSLPLDSFRVSLLPAKPARLIQSPDHSSWMLLDIQTEPDYAAAFAAPVGSLQIQYFSAEMI